MKPAMVRKEYDRLRKKYFVGFEQVPPSKELRWKWMARDHHELGHTWFDDGGDPFEIGINLLCLSIARVLGFTLLHEMTHMKLGTGPECSPHSQPWCGEVDRLSALGAFREFF